MDLRIYLLLSFTAGTKEYKKNGFIKILGGCLIELIVD